MKTQHLLLVLSFLFMLTLPAAVVSQPAVPSTPNGWEIKSIDCPTQVSSEGNGFLQIDRSGRPHIAFGGKHLYYAYRDDTGWRMEIAVSEERVDSYVSLTLDEQGNPHISYYDASNQDLKYAYRDDDGWQVETVDSEGNVGAYASHALDEQGYPHISYYDADNGDLKYAYKDSDGWHVEVVDSEGSTGRYTSLALDKGENPHVSYIDTSNRSLKYAHRDGNIWQVETVDSGGRFGVDGYTSLALDKQGNPHISYTSLFDLSYAYWDDCGWYVEVVKSVPAYVPNSLVLDTAGHPHITFYFAASITTHSYVQVFGYAYSDGNEWHGHSFVDRNISLGAGGNSSLAIDEEGLPHIVYSGIDHHLFYTHLGGDSWQEELVVGPSPVGSYASMDLDRKGYPRIGYYRNIRHHYFFASFIYNDFLMYAYKDDNIWGRVMVNSTEMGPTYEPRQVGSDTSLALDEQGYPHISSGNVGLNYVHQDGGGWHIETVDDREGNGTSLALDEQGYPHISYYDSTDNDLTYARQDENGWHIETVDTNEESLGWHTSLALDEQGYPHISYYDSTGNDLKYAYQDENGWHIEMVDGEGQLGPFTSLALDENDYPHISYNDEDNDSLKYAYPDGSGWHIETVDSVGEVGSWPSLALDDQGFPHISYYDSTNQNLNYAHRDSSGWHIEMVDSEGNAGQYTSLALDEHDDPTISYQGNECLKLAVKKSRTDTAWRFRGYTYKGEPGDTSLPLPGVNLRLYGRDEGEPEPGSWSKKITSDGSGFFNFYIVEPWVFDYFQLEAEAPPGLVTTGVWSETGEVVGPDTVAWQGPQARVHMNAFYFADPSPTPPPTHTSTATPTALPTPTATPTVTATPSATPTSLPPPDLSGSYKIASPEVVNYFEEVTYTLVVRNDGPGPAHVTLRDAPSLPYKVDSATGGLWWEEQAGALRWEGTIPAGESRQFQYVVQGPVPIIPHDTLYSNELVIDDGVHTPFTRSADILANPRATPTTTPIFPSLYLPLVFRIYPEP